MPTIECDPDRAAERLESAGLEIREGNTPHEQWRAERDGAVAVAYDDKVLIQGANPSRLALLLKDGGGRAHVYFDGACRGNPGPAAIGWLLVSSDGVIAEGNDRIGETTNNDAEYQALIQALEAADDYGLEEVDIRGDSQLIVKQVRGEWDTNEPTLRERRIRVRQLLEGFERWSLEHVPREINSRADELATDAFNE